MKRTTLPYNLEPAPAYATLPAHAMTFSAYCYEVGARSLEKLPVAMPIIKGKRQPMPIQVFSALLAELDDEALRNVCLAGLPRDFMGDVKALLPKALEVRAERRTAKGSTKTRASAPACASKRTSRIAENPCVPKTSPQAISRP